jgi:sirohydrochlorin ferrochelatase
MKEGETMKKASWSFVVAIIAVLTGGLTVQYLTVHPLVSDRYLVLLTIGLMLLLYLIVVRFAGRRRWFVLGLTLVGFLAGYWVMTARFLGREDPREVPELRRTVGDKGDGHTAVIYFTHGEPETYDPIGWINQFREFDEQGIAFIPYLVRPLFAYMLRDEYLTAGKSAHRSMHQRMLHSLMEAYRAEGDTSTQFELAFLDDNPRPDAAVVRALNAGASRIIVSEIFLTVSNHTAEGKALIGKLKVEDRFGVPVQFTGPLWDSDLLQDMFVARTEANRGVTPKEHTGILLVGHGQPAEWDREWPTETEHEIRFRQEILEKLSRAGYRRDLMGLAWMEFREPPPATAVEQLVARGATRILYFAASISADAIHSTCDIPRLVGKAKVPAFVSLINLGAWNDDPLVIRAIKEQIDRCRGQELPQPARSSRRVL